MLRPGEILNADLSGQAFRYERIQQGKLPIVVINKRFFLNLQRTVDVGCIGFSKQRKG
jgi:hypothetical protein